MSLVLGAGAYCNWNEVLPVLTALGFNEGQARNQGLELTQDSLTQTLANQYSVVFEDIDQLQLLLKNLERYPNQRVVLFYSDLSDILVHVIHAEKGMAQALAEWKKSLTVMQDVYRKYRKQTLLFNLQQVLTQPESFLEVCAKEWGCPVAKIELGSESKQSETWAKYLASQLLTHDEDLNQVFQHTKAMTWPLGGTELPDHDTKIGIVALLQQLQFYASLQNKSVLLVEKKENLEHEKLKLLQENQAVSEQMFATQEALEKQTHETQMACEELTTLRSGFTQLESESRVLKSTVTNLKTELKQSHDQAKLSDKTLKQLQADKKELTHENKLILDGMFEAQEALEKQTHETQMAREELEKQILEVQSRV